MYQKFGGPIILPSCVTRCFDDVHFHKTVVDVYSRKMIEIDFCSMLVLGTDSLITEQSYHYYHKD